MTKKEQRKSALLKHYENCSKLAAAVSGEQKDGKKISLQLLKAERLVASAALSWANGETDEDSFNKSAEKAMNKVRETLGGLPDGFFVNSDPRGYALKIDDKVRREKYPFMHQDWGGYGILSPEI